MGVIRRVVLPDKRKLIALTFDLCEQPGEVAGYDGAIVDYLRKEHIKATFFAGGKWLRSHAGARGAADGRSAVRDRQPFGSASQLAHASTACGSCRRSPGRGAPTR